MFIEPFVVRLARTEGVGLRIIVRHSTGGAGSAIAALRQYVVDLQRGRTDYADILVVAIDANSVGVAGRRKQIQRVTGNYAGTVVMAIPDPHVEAWLLADPRALPLALGEAREIDVPATATNWKAELSKACSTLGTTAVAGGIEYANAIAGHMRVTVAGQNQPTIATFTSDLQAAIRRLS